MRKSVADVLRETAEKHGIHMRDMVGPSRLRQFAWPRQEAMFEAYVQCPHASYPTIGRLIGGRDHTTVLHGVRAYCERTGISYDRVRRAFPKDHLGVTRAAPSFASEYRDLARLPHVQ